MVGVWDDSNKTILLYGNKFSLIRASKDMVQFNLVSSTEHVEILIKANGSYSEKHGDLPWENFQRGRLYLEFQKSLIFILTITFNDVAK